MLLRIIVSLFLCVSVSVVPLSLCNSISRSICSCLSPHSSSFSLPVMNYRCQDSNHISGTLCLQRHNSTNSTGNPRIGQTCTTSGFGFSGDCGFGGQCDCSAYNTASCTCIESEKQIGILDLTSLTMSNNRSDALRVA